MPGTEFYYLDESGNQQDASLHAELSNSAEAEAFSTALAVLQAYEVLGTDDGLEALYGLSLSEARAIVDG